MKITKEQFEEFHRKWAWPSQEYCEFADMRFGQAFMTWFKIDSLISPLGNVWEIRGKHETEELIAWLRETFVE